MSTQEGLEFHLTDPVIDSEFNNDPNQTAIERIGRGINMMAAFTGSVYFLNPIKRKWDLRHLLYSADVLYLLKSFSAREPIDQFDCKRASITVVDNPFPEQTEIAKAIVVGKKVSGFDFSQFKGGQNVEQDLTRALASPSSSMTLDQIIATGSWCFQALTDNENELWLLNLTKATPVEYKMRPVFTTHPDRDYKLIQIREMAKEIANIPHLLQQRKIALVKKDIETMQTWVKQLKSEGQSSKEQEYRIRELHELLDIYLYAIENPKSPVDTRKYDVSSAERRIYMTELRARSLRIQASKQASYESPEYDPNYTPLDPAVVRNLLSSGTEATNFSQIMQELSTLLNPNDLNIDWEKELYVTDFATVHPGTLTVDRNTKVPVQAKVPLKSATMTEEKRKRLVREALVLRQCRHPNLIRFYGVIYLGNDVYSMITESVIGEDMSGLLMKWRIPRYWGTVLLKDVAAGMEYLHDVQKVKHRDLNPRNILISAQGPQLTAKISEFGMVSTPVQNAANPNQTTRPYYGTPVYAAPELPELNHTPAVDVFSFAYIMWQMDSRRAPFIHEKENMMDHLERTKDYNLREKLFDTCIWNPLIVQSWQTEPKERPPFRILRRQLVDLETCFYGPPGDQSVLDETCYAQWKTDMVEEYREFGLSV